MSSEAVYTENRPDSYEDSDEDALLPHQYAPWDYGEKPNSNGTSLRNIITAPDLFTAANCFKSNIYHLILKAIMFFPENVTVKQNGRSITFECKQAERCVDGCWMSAVVVRRIVIPDSVNLKFLETRLSKYHTLYVSGVVMPTPRRNVPTTMSSRPVGQQQQYPRNVVREPRMYDMQTSQRLMEAAYRSMAAPGYSYWSMYPNNYVDMLSHLQMQYGYKPTGQGHPQGQRQSRRQSHSEGRVQGYSQGPPEDYYEGPQQHQSRGYQKGHSQDYVQGHPQVLQRGRSQGYPQGHSQAYAQEYSRGYPEGHTENYAERYAEDYPRGRPQDYPQNSRAYLQGNPQGHPEDHSQGHPEGYTQYSEGYPQGNAQGYPHHQPQGYPQSRSQSYPQEQFRYPQGRPQSSQGYSNPPDYPQGRAQGTPPSQQRVPMENGNPATMRSGRLAPVRELSPVESYEMVSAPESEDDDEETDYCSENCSSDEVQE